MKLDQTLVMPMKPIAQPDRRREYLEAGDNALREYERTGIVHPMEDVEKYILGIVGGRKLRRPKPVKVRDNGCD